MKKVLLALGVLGVLLASPVAATEDPAKTPECTAVHGQQSYFDRDYNSCRCLTGYKFGGDNKCYEMLTTESCVKEYGDNARYNAVADKCECRQESYFNRVSGKCESANNLCRALHGERAYLNFVNNKCQCESGFVLGVGDICVKREELQSVTKTVIKYSWIIDTTTPATVPAVPSDPTAVLQPSSTQVSVYIFKRNLFPGMTGADVVELQKILISKKFLKASVLGRFGPATREAVRKYQAANAIRVTGNVGPLTRELLNSGK